MASSYCTTTIGSYDVERSFSLYNAILDGKRRSLEQKTMKAFHFLNWNLRVRSEAGEEEEEIARLEEGSISEKARKPTKESQHQESSSSSDKARKPTLASQHQESSISSEKAGKQRKDQGLSSKDVKKDSQNSPRDSSANNRSNNSTIEESSLTKSEEVLKDEPSSIPEKGRKRKASLPEKNSDVAKKE